MPIQNVTAIRAYQDRTAEDIWSVVGDFWGDWHPLVAEIWQEPRGVRAFRVVGDAGVYRERLEWLSGSDRRVQYSHLEGIEGVATYRATVTVQESGRGAVVNWTAQIDAADAQRASEIASGTRVVFDAGLDALETLAARPRPEPDHPVAARSETVLQGAPDLALSVAGEPNGSACLFLHGIGGGRSNWDAQLSAVGGVARAAALDLRGYGGSSRGAAPTQLSDIFSDIDRVRNFLGVDRLILVGLSLGAWIATAYACAHPDRVSGLVLAGGCTGMSEASEDTRAAFLASRLSPLEAGLTPADFADDVVDVIAGPEATAEVRRALNASMSAIPPATYRDALHLFTTPPGPHRFGALECPVLLMTGQHDRLAPPDEIRGVSQRITEVSDHPVWFEVIDGAGHVCNLEAPGRFSAQLLAFLSYVGTQRP